MMSTRTAALALPLSALLLSGACDGDQPTEQDYDEVASGLSNLITDGAGGGDVGSMEDSVSLARGEMPLGFSLSGSGEYETERAGLRYRYGITCLDADGRPAPACGERTDQATLDLAWSGELVLPRFEGSVERAGRWTVSGLQGDVAELNGSGTFDVSASWMTDSAMGSFDLAYEGTYDAIEVDMASRRVVGGRARWVVDVERKRDGRRSSAEASFTITAELTFADDGVAALVLDGTRRYRLELASGRVVRER